MAEDAGKAVLLVDVDGVISLWGFDPDSRPPGAYASVDGILHFLSLGAGEHLRDLDGVFVCVWCTGWEEKANEHLPGALGLGPWPYLSFDATAGPRPGETTPGHWKLAAIDAYVGDRPVAWVDDALNAAVHEWAAARTAPTLLVETTPDEGLVQRHADELRAWAATLAGPRQPGAPQEASTEE